MNNVDRLYSKRVSSPCVLALPLREDGSVDELPVDQFSGQDFMLNANGFITNDIMMFEECQSDSVARSILQRLKILHPESLDQRMSVDQMMAHCVPSNYGSPAEFVSANKFVAEKVYKLYEADCKAYQAELQRQADARLQQEQLDLSKSVSNNE